MTLLNLIQKNLKTTALLVSCLCSFNLEAQNGPVAHKTIGITQIVDHPSLNSIREGILEGLSKEGFSEGKNLTVIFENAQGNPAVAAQIARKFSSLPLDAVVPISTPSAQTLVNQIKTTPIVFAAITDPISAKIVSSLENPGGNVTGVTDAPPLKEQVSFIETCIPKLKTIGVVYNPGEVNSVSFLEALKKLAKTKHIKVMAAAAHKSSEVKAAAQSLVEKVDVFFIGNDNTVISGLEALIQACLDAKKPLFVSDADSVDRGALAAYAYEQRQMGRQVGHMVARVLKGEKPTNIPVERAQDIKFFLNSQTAEKIKVTCAFTG